jgi:hypothetical protein
MKQSKNFNTDCAEKQVKPQIFTEKGPFTWETSCVPYRDNLFFSVQICGLIYSSVKSVLNACLLAFFAARFQTDERHPIKPAPARFKRGCPAPTLHWR